MPDPSDVEAARVDSLADGDGVWTPPMPRDAATVCLLRDTDAGPEVFVLRRNPSMNFAARMYVYPGGAVERSDADVLTTGHADDAWLDARTASDRGRAVLVAAARETFEECGVLLAVDADGRPAAYDDRVETEREALLRDELAFAELLAERGLVVDDAGLVPFAQWLTPETEDRRFDARFFVAAQPEGQQARHVGGESDRSAWWRPLDALAAYAEGRMAMWPPTIATMRFLAQHSSAEEAVAAARAAAVVPVMPELIRDGDGFRVRLVHARTREFVAESDAHEYGGDA
jgi:8-oxo-dGTP pyrophosphatase MutT (NUDIX family)